MVAGIVNLSLALAGDGAARRIEIEAEPGLRFSITRFAVEPGSEVELVLTNADEMQHNLVITEPAAREEVAMQAIQLGSQGPAKNYVPDSDKVLFSTPVLYNGQSHTLTFEAPDEEGVYPYVCTFPGHAFVMYGAMYVTTGELPPVETDTNLPEYARRGDESEAVTHAHGGEEMLRPQFRRTFVPEAGPAAIAVHVGDGLSYVWDADTCHLRYAWRDGFLDSTDHWRGNGSSFSVIRGHIYYRAGRAFPIRLGDAGRVPERRFLGYRIVDGLPVFLFELDGYEVRQRITALKGETGLKMRFEIPEADVPVLFAIDSDAGAAFTASAGVRAGDFLRLRPEEARDFTIRLVERSGREPIGYWPMNDVMNGFNRNSMVDGVVGRAWRISGNEIATGISGSDLAAGGTIAGWVRIGETGRANQVIWGGRAEESWKLGYNLDGHDGFSLTYPGPDGSWRTQSVSGAGPAAGWNHFAMTLEPDSLEIFVNGKRVADLGRAALALDVEIGLAGAGVGEDFRLTGALDEVRIWSRVLDEAGVKRLFDGEARTGGILK